MYAILARLSALVNAIAVILVATVFFLGLKEVPLGPWIGTIPTVQFLGLMFIVVVAVNVFSAAAGAIATDPRESDFHFDQGFSLLALIGYTITAAFVAIGMFVVDQRINSVMDVPIAVWILGAFVLFGVFDVGILQRGNRKWFRDQANARRQQQATAAAAAAAVAAAAAANPPAGGAPAAAGANQPAGGAPATATVTNHAHSGWGWAAFAIVVGLIAVFLLALAYSNRGEFKKTDTGMDEKEVACYKSEYVGKNPQGLREYRTIPSDC